MGATSMSRWLVFLPALAILLACVCLGCPHDKIPPENVANLAAVASDSYVALTWSNPADTDLAGVRIQRAVDGPPAGPEDGQTIYDGTGQAFSDTGLANGIPHFYAAYAHDRAGNYAGGVTAVATPVSAVADARILRQFADVTEGTGAATELPPDERGQLSGKLDEALHAYQAGDPCGAAELLGEYGQLAQTFRATAGGETTRRGRCEALYNAGRNLRYDMLAGLPAKAQCPGQERIGAVAEASMDEAQSDNTKLRALVTFGEPRLSTQQVDSETFTRLDVPGAKPSGGNAGAPALPSVCRLYAVPQDAEVVIEATAGEAESFFVNVSPVQDLGEAARDVTTREPPEDSPTPPAFVKDDALYASNQWYPQAAATTRFVGTRRGLRIYAVQVPAGRYLPAEQRLVLYKNVEIKATFSGGKGWFVTEASLNPFECHDRTLAVDVINAGLLDEFVGPGPVASLDGGEEFLILTHPDFKEHAHRLAAWKNQNGLVTGVHVVCDGDGPGEDTAAAIRMYIETRYKTATIRPSYVMLLGDLQHIPPFYMISGVDPNGRVCTDWPYSKMEARPGSDMAQFWDSYLYTNDDLFSDVAVGRVPAEISADANSYVDAVIEYEGEPPMSREFYRRLAVASHFQCCSNWGPAGAEEVPFIATSEELHDIFAARGYDAQRIYKETVYNGNPDAVPPVPGYTRDSTPRYDYWDRMLDDAIGPDSGFSWNGGVAQVANAWTEGRFLMIHLDHGWLYGWNWPEFNAWDAANYLVGNVPARPFVFSMNCSSGQMDQQLLNPADLSYAFGQVLFWAPCQTMGLIGSTRISGLAEIVSLLRGYVDALFPEVLPSFGSPSFTFKRLGQVLLYGASALMADAPTEHNRIINHVIMLQCYGDPTVAIRTTYPYDVQLPENVDLRFNGDMMEAAYSVENTVITVMRESAASAELTPIGRGTVHGGVAVIQTVGPARSGETLHVAVNASDAIPVQMPVQLK